MDKDGLLRLIRRDKEPFPREVMRWYPEFERGQVQSEEEFLNYVYMSRDCFVGLFSEYQRKEREYDMVFLDIDNEDAHQAYAMCYTVMDRLRSAGVEHMLVCYSGSKGYHLYIPFKPTRLSNYSEAIKMYLEELDIKHLIDVSSIEERRIPRLPYTVNSKSGMMCVPIYHDDSFMDAQARARGEKEPAPINIIGNAGLGEKLRELDGEAYEKRKEQFIIDGACSVMFDKKKDYPPCMGRLIEMATQGVDLNHEERLNMGIFLMHILGGDEDKAKEFYTKMSDYKEATTRYQLSYIKQRQLHIMGCDNLTDQGICCKAHNECPFYPSINKFLRADNVLKVSRV